MSAIITRFAPSPTGYLHIGGARTALFNWLYARGKIAEGTGKFLLRIEDTDRSRHNEGAVAAILDGLEWLGLDWDGEPISQFERAERHAEVAQQLLENGQAYRCWLDGDELVAARDQAREANTRFVSPWRDHPGPYPDTPFAIRLKAPATGTLEVPDLVQGDVRFDASTLDDMVLLRSDGTPTYMLAVVVDDHDMEISHIIRGDDHLVNAARQTLLFQAMNWQVPAFGHLPLIHGQDGSKLSKRHGALGVEAYRDLGFLPQGLSNYLLRLGWSHGDNELLTMDQAKAVFDLSGINKAPARLDLDKLSHVNAHHMRSLTADDYLSWARPFIEAAHGEISADELERLKRALPFLKNRTATLCDVPGAAAFILLKMPFEITGKAAKPLKKDGANATLENIANLLQANEDWSVEPLDALLQGYADEKQVGFGQVGPPVRAALTAGNPSPTLGEVLFSLGKEEALARIRAQIQ